MEVDIAFPLWDPVPWKAVFSSHTCTPRDILGSQLALLELFNRTIASQLLHTGFKVLGSAAPLVSESWLCFCLIHTFVHSPRRASPAFGAVAALGSRLNRTVSASE